VRSGGLETPTPLRRSCVPPDPADFRIEWNAEDQLTRVLKDSVEIASFKYDPVGRRVEKVISGATNAYTYDGEDVIRQGLGGGNSRAYVHGPRPDEPMSREDAGGATVYFHGDALGSIVSVTDTNGVGASSRQYNAWGLEDGAPAESGYGYTGREWDSETGLYYYRARYYDPHDGAFISEDPLMYLAGLNLRSYVDNNPVRFIDPSGLQGQEEARRCGPTLFGPNLDRISFAKPDPRGCDPVRVRDAVKNVARRMQQARSKQLPPPGEGEAAAYIDVNARDPDGRRNPAAMYLPSGDPCVDYCRCLHETIHLEQARAHKLAGEESRHAVEAEAYQRQLWCLTGCPAN